MCLRSMRTYGQMRQQAEARELAKEVEAEYGLHLSNRQCNRVITNPWDDYFIAALSETKHIWKH